MRGLRGIAVPRLLYVAPAALRDLPRCLEPHFDLERVAVVTGTATSRALSRGLVEDLERRGSRVQVHAGVGARITDSALLLERLDESPVTLVVAFGGGRPIDVAKLAATRAGVDLVAVPTVLSHDGMCSPVASLIGADGARRSLGAAMPAGIVIDTDVVGAAPLRYLRAGVADLVSNVTAVEDWRRAEVARGEVVDEFAASIAVLSARSALEIGWPPDHDDLEVISRGLVMSGLAMEVAGSSRPCSGAEHLVSHALDALRGPSAALHGEQVALGVVVVSGLHDDGVADRTRALFARIGLPTTLQGWELDAATLVEAIQLAPSTRPDRYTILDETDLDVASVEKLVADLFPV
jgi:glycerol-1-phosphate dehydrogenase [NAD(P)+]